MEMGGSDPERGMGAHPRRRGAVLGHKSRTYGGQVCYPVRGARTELRGPGKKDSMAPEQDGKDWTRKQSSRDQKCLDAEASRRGGLEARLLRPEQAQQSPLTDWWMDGWMDGLCVLNRVQLLCNPGRP